MAVPSAKGKLPNLHEPTIQSSLKKGFDLIIHLVYYISRCEEEQHFVVSFSVNSYFNLEFGSTTAINVNTIVS